MIKQTSEKLLHDCKLEFEQLWTQVTDPSQRYSQSQLLIGAALKKLRQLIDQNAFKDQQEEIYFFKKVKPALCAYRIYTTKVYGIESRIPLTGREKQIRYFENEISCLEHALNKNAYSYHYYKIGADEYDEQYFIRGRAAASLLAPHIPDLDPAFSTTGDYLFSKFMAMDMLRDWLVERLSYLKSSVGNTGISGAVGRAGNLVWTGDAVNLAELGYALYFTGQLNNGTAGIAQIFRWLEEQLKVTIGVPAKRFTEISARKRLSRTRYLDQMKDSLLAKMDQEDAFNPGKRGF